MANTIADQVQFYSLDEFVERQKNFYVYFLNSEAGREKREDECYKRFERKCPIFSRRLIKDVEDSLRKYPDRSKLPYERLRIAYSEMATFVYREDKGVVANKKLNREFLIR